MARMLRDLMADEVHNPLCSTPEYALCTAIMVRAFQDLQATDPMIHNSAARWFAKGECAWLCEVLDLDVRQVQAKAQNIAARGPRDV